MNEWRKELANRRSNQQSDHASNQAAKKIELNSAPQNEIGAAIFRRSTTRQEKRERERERTKQENKEEAFSTSLCNKRRELVQPQWLLR